MNILIWFTTVIIGAACMSYFLKRQQIAPRDLSTIVRGDSKELKAILVSIISCAGMLSTGMIHYTLYGGSFQLNTIGKLVGSLGILYWYRLQFQVFYFNPHATAIIEPTHNITECRDGPYSNFKHPLYMGGILFFLSSSLLFQSDLAALWTVPFALSVIYRASLEDRHLALLTSLASTTLPEERLPSSVRSAGFRSADAAGQVHRAGVHVHAVGDRPKTSS